MASMQETDCFHDNSDGDEEDSLIVDVEWNKLKFSHMKDGFRDGYSAGQEAVLQQAFNQGFAHQVKLEMHIAFYKGILTALKTFAEKMRMSKRQNPKMRLSVDDALRIESLLTELDAISGGMGSADERDTSGTANMKQETRIGTVERTELKTKNEQEHFTNLKFQNFESDVSEDNKFGNRGKSSQTCTGEYFQSSSERESLSENIAYSKWDDRTKSKSNCKESHSTQLPVVSQGVVANKSISCCRSIQPDNQKKETDIGSSSTPPGNQCLSRKSENASAKGQTSCCNPSGCSCQSVNSEGETAHGRTSVPNRCKEAIPESDSWSSKLKTTTWNCQHLLKELGIEDIVLLNQSTTNIYNERSSIF